MAPQPRDLAAARREIIQEFPSLKTTTWEITSPFDTDYNCFAWAACDVQKRWEPSEDWYWPEGCPLDPTVEAFVATFQTFGYRVCMDDHFEIGFQKIAIYSKPYGYEEWVTHMARQDLLGRHWLSKLGDLEDITHSRLKDLNGAGYGKVAKVMKRSWVATLWHWARGKFQEK